MKDLRKAAFAVGFGFTMGKFVGELVNAAITGVGIGVLQFAANNGNDIAQKTCKESGIKTKSEKKEDESK